MYKSSIRACLFIILLIAPLALYAAGLGKLTLSSALGQPLRAEISLVAVNNNEIPSLNVKLASPDAFAQAGIDYKPFFSTFRLSVEPRSNGDPYIRITSPQAINEPFVNMLVELNWASGRLLREYTVLLDPVSNAPVTTAVPTVRSAQPVQQSLVEETTVETPIVETPIVEYAEQPVEDQRGYSESLEEQSVYVDRSGDSYAVNKGDTLSSIARQYLPYDADLNQMLVALYRANRDAFIQDNMNLLKVGAILNVPTSAEVAMIEKEEARAEIKIQVADWQAYRDRLAALASGAQATDVRSQTAEGQISTTVGDKAIAERETSKEVLRLSSGGQATGDDLGGNETLARLRMMEEDSIARNLALKEANERVAMLEKNIEDLQQLLELKDSSLAKAQQQADIVAGDEPMPETNTDVTTFPSEPVSELLEDDDAIIDQDVELDASLGFDESLGEVVETPTLPQPLPQTIEVSFIDQIIAQVMENIAYVAGALGVLLLGILALFIKKRKESEDVDDMDNMDFDDLSPSVTTGSDAVTDDGMERYALNEGDGEVYENRDDQSFDEAVAKSDDAEENTDFFLDDDVQDDEKTVEEDPIDLSAETEQDGIDASSESDVELRMNGETDNELSDKEISEEVASDTIEDSSESSNEMDFDLGDAEEETVVQEDDDDTDTLADGDLSSDEINLTNSSEQDADESTKGVGFDSGLDSSDDNASDEASPIEFDSSTDNENEISFSEEHNEASSLVMSDDQTDEIELDDELDASDEDVAVTDSEQIPPLELDDIDLNLDEVEPEQASAPESEPEQEAEFELDSEPADVELTEENVENNQNEEKEVESSPENETDWQEVETKIDLAKAYQELDDKEGAREILEEVMRDGDDDQKQKAESMLADL